MIFFVKVRRVRIHAQCTHSCSGSRSRIRTFKLICNRHSKILWIPCFCENRVLSTFTFTETLEIFLVQKLTHKSVPQIIQLINSEMASSLRILSVGTTDVCSPAVLLVGPKGKKILVNCGEGCQRAFLEFKQSIKSVSTVALCSLSANMIGGLPGFILTSADTNVVALKAALEYRSMKQSQQPKQRGDGSSKKKKEGPPEVSMNLIGPSGTHDLVNSLRHFMDRGVSKVPLNVFENMSGIIDVTSHQNKSQHTDFEITGIPIRLKAGTTCNNLDTADDYHEGPNEKRARLEAKDEMDVDTTAIEAKSQYMSYVFKTPSIPGKLDVKKAKELGIPRGPLYGDLKQGKSITFQHPTSNEDVVVHPHQVIGPTTPGVIASVIYCPNISVLKKLEKHPDLVKYFKAKNHISNTDSMSSLEVMVHMTPKEIIDSNEYRSWLKNFCPDVEHIILNSGEVNGVSVNNINGVDESPFRDFYLDCIARNLICKSIYPVPLSWNTESIKSLSLNSDVNNIIREENYIQNIDRSKKEGLNFVIGRNMLTYTIAPFTKRGFDDSLIRNPISIEEVSQLVKDVRESGISEVGNFSSGSDDDRLIFAGTGSAIPSKVRNVSGIYLSYQTKIGMTGILLDPGEGTIGNLLRIWAADESCSVEARIRSIKLVWISHPHADHHLGILRLLHEKSKLEPNPATVEDKIIIVAADPILDFLSEYTNNNAKELKNCFHCLSANRFLEKVDVKKPLDTKVSPDIRAHLQGNLGLKNISCVFVNHCQYAYAVSIKTESDWGTFAYSGDCRPSDRFAKMVSRLF